VEFWGAVPIARSDAAGTTINGLLYVIGGNGPQGFLSSVEAYDPLTNTSTEKAPLPIPLGSLSGAATVLNSYIYLCGGALANGQLSSAVYVYDPLSDSWSTVNSMPIARQGLGTASAAGKLYALGGYIDNNSITAEVDAFTPNCSPPPCQFATSVTSNFNGTPIHGGNYIWFNGVLKPSGLGSNPVTIRFTHQTITSANFTLSVPDASVTFDPAATSATTTFSGGMWVTRVPSSGLAGNTFLSALGYLVPTNLPGGIRNVTWSGTISSDTPGVSMQWKWAAAVYANFSSDYNALGVKPVDDNRASQYQNSDHAGTPENFKPYVIGGPTGGGGSNYTGGYSGTAAVGPCQP
jgi:hypothetical protein